MVRPALLVVFLCCLLPCLTGCNTTSDERIAALQTALDSVEAKSKQYDATIATLMPSIATLQKALTDPNLTGPNASKLATELADLQAKYQVLVSLKATVDQQATAYDAVLQKARADGNIDIQKELSLYGQGAVAVSAALPPPFNAILLGIGAVLTAAGGIAGAFVKGQATQGQVATATQAANTTATQATDQLSTAQTAIQGIVASVDALLQSPLVTNAKDAKALLAAHQASNAPQAAVAVQEIRANAAS